VIMKARWALEIAWIHYGRGRLCCLPARLRDALLSTSVDITQPVALRLLGKCAAAPAGTLPPPWQWTEIGNVVTNGWSWYEDNAFGLAAAARTFGIKPTPLVTFINRLMATA